MSRKSLDHEESLWNFVWGKKFSDRAPFLLSFFTLIGASALYIFEPSAYSRNVRKNNTYNERDVGEVKPLSLDYRR